MQSTAQQKKRPPRIEPGPLGSEAPFVPTPARRAHYDSAPAVAATVCGDARAHFARKIGVFQDTVKSRKPYGEQYT